MAGRLSKSANSWREKAGWRASQALPAGMYATSSQRAPAGGTRNAANAREVFAYQVRKTIGAYAAAMGGVDAVAFTGGIGENSPELRAACCGGLEFLGIRLDSAANETGAGDRVVSEKDAPATVIALSTNE